MLVNVKNDINGSVQIEVEGIHENNAFFKVHL